MGVCVLNTRSARHAFQYFVNNLPPPLHFMFTSQQPSLQAKSRREWLDKNLWGSAMPHHVRQLYRLVVVGGERVGKTAIIEQLIFGNHVIGQVKSCTEIRQK